MYRSPHRQGYKHQSAFQKRFLRTNSPGFITKLCRTMGWKRPTRRKILMRIVREVPRLRIQTSTGTITCLRTRRTCAGIIWVSEVGGPLPVQGSRQTIRIARDISERLPLIILTKERKSGVEVTKVSCRVKRGGSQNSKKKK